MGWWSTVTPGQLFAGGLLVGFGLMILFWQQILPPLKISSSAPSSYTRATAGPGSMQNGPNSVIITYDLPPGTTSIEMRGFGGGGGGGAGPNIEPPRSRTGGPAPR